MNESVEAGVYSIISGHMAEGAAEPGPASTLKDLGIESLDAIEIIFEIEEKFDVTLPDRDPNFDVGSVQGLLDAVAAALARKSGSAPAAS